MDQKKQSEYIISAKFGTNAADFTFFPEGSISGSLLPFFGKEEAFDPDLEEEQPRLEFINHVDELKSEPVFGPSRNLTLRFDRWYSDADKKTQLTNAAIFQGGHSLLVEGFTLGMNTGSIRYKPEVKTPISTLDPNLEATKLEYKKPKVAPHVTTETAVTSS